MKTALIVPKAAIHFFMLTNLSDPAVPRPALNLLPGRWAVCRLPAGDPVPLWASNADSPLVSITRTASELSLVVSETFVPPSTETLHVEAGWRVFAVAGPMPFELVGVLANLTAPLAHANVPIFAISTFDTDYLLVKETDLPNAVTALRAAGYSISDG